jgi:SAM-dependent methyltransferase
MVTARPLPTKAEMQAFYDGFMFGVPTDPTSERNMATINHDVNQLCRCFEERTGKRLRGRLLDWGGGAGFHAAAFAAQGLKVTMVDMDAQACRYAAERFGDSIRVIHADAVAMAISEPYDAVFCSHVIEHATDPGKFMLTLKSALRPGGTLLLTTPNQQCQEYWCRPTWWIRYLRLVELGLLPAFFRFQRIPWICCDPPRHLHAFNARSLEKLLTRYDFRVLDSFSESYLHQYHASGRFRPDLEFRRPASVFRIGMEIYTLASLHVLNLIDSGRRWGNNLVVYAEAGSES